MRADVEIDPNLIAKEGEFVPVLACTGLSEYDSRVKSKNARVKCKSCRKIAEEL